MRTTAPREGTLDMLMSRSSAVRKRLGNVEKVSIEYIEASGDCFYLAMELALSEAEGWHPFYAVSTMREVVALPSILPAAPPAIFTPRRSSAAEP